MKKSLRQFMIEACEVLGIVANEQQEILSGLDSAIRLKVIALLVKDLPQEQREGVTIERIKSRYSVAEIRNTYLKTAARAVVPGLLKTLLRAATAEEKQKIKHLAYGFF